MNDWCEFVTDSASGFGLIHCQLKSGHEGEHQPPRPGWGPLIRKDPVWRKYQPALPSAVVIGNIAGAGVEVKPLTRDEFPEDELYGGLS